MVFICYLPAITYLILINMPYSFTQIEKTKSKTIAWVFCFLILFYFVSIWLIVAIVVNASPAVFSDGEYHKLKFIPIGLDLTAIIFFISFVIGFIHWHFTTNNLINKILKVMAAEKLKENDTYHIMLRNIIDEVSVATGGTKIEAVVVPVTAMNAFSLSDFDGRSVIGVTEGLLSRLSRSQLEAVIGHEAAHIVSGDCLETTVTSSMFELYNSLLKGIELLLKGNGRGSYYGSRTRNNFGFIIIMYLIYMLLFFSKFMSNFIRMFISRQREYRADAIAVRLTRDPLSLSEALYSIVYYWRGEGLASQELESIFIINPRKLNVDENSGIFADLFSTHPPLDKRIQILLDMAHANVHSLDNSLHKNLNRARIDAPENTTEDKEWMVNKDGAWQGPFNLVKLVSLDWLRPDAWVKRVGGAKIVKAQEEQEIGLAISSAAGKSGLSKCPKCKVPLYKIHYEGVEVEKCGFCRGTLVNEADMDKIILRTDVGFNDRIKRIGESIKTQAKNIGQIKINRDPKMLLECPTCKDKRIKMSRMFYGPAYFVEVDKCLRCRRIWFDSDELEVLQYLIEDKNKN